VNFNFVISFTAHSWGFFGRHLSHTPNTYATCVFIFQERVI
jgi:hypothetical protein